jgi:hypothetical protein
LRRILSGASRSAFAALLFLLVLAVLRWGPVYAEPPWAVRALPLAGPALLLAVLAAITGVERPARNVRPLLGAVVLLAASLCALVALRPEAGLAGEVRARDGAAYALAPGPVDLVGRELRDVPALRQWSVRWRGTLRAPESGRYRLWAGGRGEVTVILDGRPALRLEGERLRGGSDVALGRGSHEIDVEYLRVGPGPRLRLGWTTPAGRSEVIPPRLLGPQGAAWSWTLTDVFALALAGALSLLALFSRWDRPRALPAPAPVGSGELGLSLLAHASLFVFMSWPLMGDPAGSGLVGSPDGRLNTWILAWDVHALLHAPARLFQAPIFHPLPDTLAFSENLLLPAAISAPVLLAGGPVLAYNLLLLLSSALSGLGAQLLVRRVTRDALAAFVAGAAFGVGVHRFARMAHLHAHVTLFLPFALLALDRFRERRSTGRGLLVGLLLALQGLSSIYLGAITGVTLAAASLLALPGLRRREAARLLGGLVFASLLLSPLMLPYLRMRAFQGVEFTQAEVARFATTAESYASSASLLYAPLSDRHLDPSRVRDTLFPGLVPLILGVAGLGAAPRRYRAVALLASAVAVLLSLGPETAPYRFLHEHVVLFRGIRALGRFAIVPALGLAVLTGLALAGRSRHAVLGALVLLLVESRVGLEFARYEPPSAAARWLAGRPGAVAYLPFGDGDTQAMLDGIAHFRPLLNGDSGFIPRPYDRLRELLDDGPSDDALRLLRAVGTSHLVSRAELPLPLAARFGEERVYDVPPGELAEVVSPGRQVPTLWGPEGILLDLGAPRELRRIAFELSDAPWVRRPEVAISSDGSSWTELRASARLGDGVLSLMHDPQRGKGEVRFPPARMRYVRLDRRLPARGGVLWAD